MPREDRRITFSYDEVYKALYTLCSQKGLPIPPVGNILRVREDQKDISKIYVEIDEQAERAKEQLEYSRDFVAAALMVFCRGVGIPLPKGGRKSVMFSEGQAVVLRIQI